MEKLNNMYVNAAHLLFQQMITVETDGQTYVIICYPSDKTYMCDLVTGHEIDLTLENILYILSGVQIKYCDTTTQSLRVWLSKDMLEDIRRVLKQQKDE